MKAVSLDSQSHLAGTPNNFGVVWSGAFIVGDRSSSTTLCCCAW